MPFMVISYRDNRKNIMCFPKRKMAERYRTRELIYSAKSGNDFHVDEVKHFLKDPKTGIIKIN